MPEEGQEIVFDNFLWHVHIKPLRIKQKERENQ
jgi:hypothetical protein